MQFALNASSFASWIPGRGPVSMIDPNKQYVGFGWTNFDAVRLPCIDRGEGLRLVAKRLADAYLLGRFPRAVHERLFTRTAYYQLSTPEAELLTHLCRDGLKAQFCFTSSDLAVSLAEFREVVDFFRQRSPVGGSSSETSDGVERPPVCAPDWILVRDSVIPCVGRVGDLLLPLNVLRGAPRVLIDVPVKTASATTAEVQRLNELCRNSLLTFTFNEATELVRLSDLRALCPDVRIDPLGSDNPLLALKASMRQASKAARDTDPEKRALSADVSRQMDKRCLETSKCDETQKPSDAPESTTRNGLPKPASVDEAVGHRDQITLSDIRPPPLIPIDDVKDLNGLSLFKAGTISCGPDRDITEPKEKDYNPENMHEYLDNTKGKVTGENEDGPIGSKSAEISRKVEIVQVECFKRTLTCITRGKLRARYALVESVMHLYFPQCRLDEFIRYLDHELSVTLHTLKKREEQALITFYGIPTDRLHANLIIRLKDFVHRAAWLQNRFGDMDVPNAARPPPPSPLKSQKNKITAATHPKIKRARNVGVRGAYKDKASKLIVPQYSKRRLDAVSSETINNNPSTGDVKRLNSDMPYCRQTPRSLPQPWTPVVNAADTMKLPNYSTPGTARMQQQNFGFQQVSSDQTKASSENVIKDIQRMVNREFATHYLHPQAPYVYDPTPDVPNNSRANWTGNKRAHPPDSFPSKRMAPDFPGLPYPVHQLGPEGSSPFLPMGL